MWRPGTCRETFANPRAWDIRTVWRLRHRLHADPRVDANGGAERSYFIRYIREHPLPRVLSPSRFPEVWIPRFVAHTRILRTSSRTLPSCEGYAAEEAVLDTRDGWA